MEGLKKHIPRPLDAFAAEHDVTLDLRAWVRDGRGGTWVQGSTEDELLAKLADEVDGY